DVVGTGDHELLLADPLDGIGQEALRLVAEPARDPIDLVESAAANAFHRGHAGVFLHSRFMMSGARRYLTPSSLAMTTPTRFHRLRDVLDRRQPDLTVLLENVEVPRNLAAILRSCDAVGALEAHAVWPGE